MAGIYNHRQDVLELLLLNGDYVSGYLVKRNRFTTSDERLNDLISIALHYDPSTKKFDNIESFDLLTQVKSVYSFSRDEVIYDNGNMDRLFFI